MAATGVDDLAESLALSFSVTAEVNSTDAPHPRFHMFKAKGVSQQAERRRKFLEETKQRRQDFGALARRLALGETAGSDDEEGSSPRASHKRAKDSDESDREDESQASRKFKCVEDTPAEFSPQKRRPNPYKNQVMLSEWMEEVPEDLESAWLVKMVPVGKRMLVVSSRGCTAAYFRNGYCAGRFPSALPGGRQMSENYRGSDFCILDCIYDEAKQTYYVLDLMYWRTQPLYDSDTDFRFYWLQTKVAEELPSLAVRSHYNPYTFVVLPFYTCGRASLQSLMTTPFPYERDGLLFFHKEARYVAQRNPACLWLKPNMTEELLGIADGVFMDGGPAPGRQPPKRVINKIQQKARGDAMAQ